MKKLILLCGFLFIAFALCLPVHARIYVDDMTELSNNNIKQYSGLKKHEISGGGSSAYPDKTVSVFENIGDPLAWAQYRVENCTTVSAGVYTIAGTFVLPNLDNPAQLMLGVYREDMSQLKNQSAVQALFCRGTGAVYTNTAGLQQLYCSRTSYYFGPVITPPANDLTGYAINFYYSMDGKVFTRVPAWQSNLQFSPSNSFCYEEYTAATPAGAKYVRVEINDFASLPYSEGGTIPKNTAQFTMLANATLSGDQLTLGEPEPAVQEPVVSQETKQAEKNVSEKETEETQTKSAAEPVSPAAQSSVKSETSSKFAGIVTESSRAEVSKKSSSKPASSTKSSQSASTQAEKTGEAPAPQESGASVIYEIPREDNDATFNTWIIAYIIGICVLVAIVLVIPRKK